MPPQFNAAGWRREDQTSTPDIAVGPRRISEARRLAEAMFVAETAQPEVRVKRRRLPNEIVKATDVTPKLLHQPADDVVATSRTPRVFRLASPLPDAAPPAIESGEDPVSKSAPVRHRTRKEAALSGQVTVIRFAPSKAEEPRAKVAISRAASTPPQPRTRPQATFLNAWPETRPPVSSTRRRVTSHEFIAAPSQQLVAAERELERLQQTAANLQKPGRAEAIAWVKRAMQLYHISLDELNQLVTPDAKSWVW